MQPFRVRREPHPIANFDSTCRSNRSHHGRGPCLHIEQRFGSELLDDFDDGIEAKVARLVALSPFARAKFIEGGLPADRIVVKPNFTADPGAPDTDRRFGALFVGRLGAELDVA